MSVVALTFVKFELLSSNCTQILYIDQKPLILNLVKTDWSIQIFWDCEFFENFVRESTNTKWYSIQNLVTIGEGL